ncbi:MAG TPA: hypothetical protein VJP77_06100, partial [Planctomycetota bacterium]|nr:hypothetical protein [Planctomycetota bacterium]
MPEQHARTLILDAEPELRATLAGALRAQGHPVAEAHPGDAQTALPPSDVVLLVLRGRARTSSLDPIPRL